MNDLLIEQQFHIVFSADDEDVVLLALNTLIRLGLSHQQVIDGIKAGVKFIDQNITANQSLEKIIKERPLH
jgi:hypothetical protein